jgi:hypothetical protein
MSETEEIEMPGIADLAATAFEKRVRVKMLEMMNVPADYAERKKAVSELALARHEALQAEEALRALNPCQTSLT